MMNKKPELLSDDKMRRIMVLQPIYSDDADHAHTIRMGRAVEDATRAEADRWRARFEWLAAQHWVEPEAAFRLDLADTGDDSAAYMARLIAAVDARRETPNVEANLQNTALLTDPERHKLPAVVCQVERPVRPHRIFMRNSMNDRELIESAAKAAGYEYTVHHLGGSDYAISIGGYEWWNPLSDDGEALRLSVKLGLDVSHDARGQVIVDHHTLPRRKTIVMAHGADPCEATRRAITLAAAAMAGGMAVG